MPVCLWVFEMHHVETCFPAYIFCSEPHICVDFNAYKYAVPEAVVPEAVVPEAVVTETVMTPVIIRYAVAVAIVRSVVSTAVMTAVPTMATVTTRATVHFFYQGRIVGVGEIDDGLF